MTKLDEPEIPASRRTDTQQGRIPDFFIVGHPKCGTTALYHMLRSHPQIFMPLRKEPRFFASDVQRNPRLRDTAAPVVETLEQYLSLFSAAKATQRAGEATPIYLVSRGAAAAIAEVQPNARIIAILREPASFLRSYHFQLVQARYETQRDFRKALALEDRRREGKEIPRSAARPQQLFYSDFVRYGEQLARYHAVFPPEQVLTLIYDDYRSDNEGTVRRVLRFLEVDDRAPITVVDANPTVQVRFQHAHAMLHAVSVGRSTRMRAIKNSVRAVIPPQWRSRALETARSSAIYGSPTPPDEEFMRELRRRCSVEVVALSDYLHRDLVSLWGYDELT